MWKAFFLGIGMSMVVLGAESLTVDKVVLAARNQAAKSTTFGTPVAARREVAPPEWFPWSMMAGGVVVMMYSYTIPKMVSE